MFRSLNFRPALLWFSISLALVFALGAVVCLLSFSPLLGQKVESLRYRVLELLPPPPHTEFVPTPLPTLFVARVLDPTATPEPTDAPTETVTATDQPTTTPTRALTPTPAVDVKPIQAAVQLTGVTHDYQRWNNCGPTTLEMYLSFFGKHDTQAQIASALKPDPDDKNVRPDEMAGYARGDGLDVIVRVNGTLDRIKLFLSNGLPLIVETGFDPPRAHQGWMGHYRLITGYDDKNFITQDSYDGPDVRVEFGTLEADWRAFNRTYILLYTKAQAPLVRAILGGDLDDKKMYAAAVAQAQRELAANPQDAFGAFNLGSSLLGLKRYDEATAAFDQARTSGLPWRMLWYQFGPYEAYYRVGRYDELLALASATLKVMDDLEESHYYKGLALEKLGRYDEARDEFASALKYNRNFTDARRELAKLEQQ
jgi:uncharacterized protein YvpB